MCWWQSKLVFVAVLHDVVEDSNWTFEALLAEGFSIEVIEALQSVTKESPDEDYDLFIQRAIHNPIGRKVKLADLRDNLDVTRITELAEKDLQRINKYKKALKILSVQASSTNSHLPTSDTKTSYSQLELCGGAVALVGYDLIFLSVGSIHLIDID